MNCFCGKKAIISGYCKDHFIEYVENKVKQTIENFNLFTKKDRIVVATSGGKDSLTVLYILNKLGYNVEGLLIDEGISNYREHTISDLRKFSEQYNIKFRIISFKEEFNYTLDEIVTKIKDTLPCTFCGIFRRYLLNKYSKQYDVLVTGHNLDDESQSVLMNLLKNQIPILARIGPVAGIKRMNFTKRVKPLYLLTEKEIKAYTILLNFPITYSECPYAKYSYRNHVIDFIHKFSNSKAIKENIINFHLERLSRLKEKYQDTELRFCKICNEPSTKEICNSCKLVIKIKGEMNE
ncbi:MAG: TIGR00269 family protein [Candidatus Woesearchaeota archaeon]